MNINRSLVLLASLLGGIAAAQIEGERTLRDGVYSDAQATRGKSTYDSLCSSCHEGGSMAPGLKGDDFLASWENKSVRALYSRAFTTMPSDAPGTLQEQELLDIIAYLIQANGFAVGDKPFTSAADLDQIRIVRSK
jgi:mono/diheme cytochrome c family protein